MSRDSNGDYSLPAGVNPVVAGTTITDDWANTTLSDVATALTDSWDRQGRGAPLANLSMGSFKFTSMAAGSASTDSIRYGQAINQDAVTIASASTVDLASNLQSNVAVTGTTTITSFGTGAAAGVRKFVTFTGALSLTNSANLICPSGANLSVAAGDTIVVQSEGSNVWRVNKAPTVPFTAPDGTVSLPGIAFANDLDTGFYRIGANNLGMALNGVKYADFATSLFSFTPGGGTYNFGANLALTSAGTVTLTSAAASAITIQGGLGGLQSHVNILSGGQGAINITGHSANGQYRANVSITSGNITGAFGGGTQAGTVTITSGYHTDNSSGSVGGDIVLNAQGNQSGRTACGGSIKFQVTPQLTTYTVAQVSGNSGAFVYDSSYGTPSIVSGAGTGATIVGTNYGFTITLGTTPGTSIIINYSTWRGLTGAPSLACAVPVYQGASTVAAQLSASSSSQITITLSTTPTAGDKVHVMSQFYA